MAAGTTPAAIVFTHAGAKRRQVHQCARYIVLKASIEIKRVLK